MPETPTTLQQIIARHINAHGPVTFAWFMETALYHPEFGYYRQPERKPGRGGDFITSPELHPFFGNTLARQVAEAWDALNKPQKLIVREHGASSGGLAYDIMVALSEKAPDVLKSLDYRLVDVNTHRLEEAITAMEEVGFANHISAENPESLTPEPGLVLANEVADALPVHRFVMREGSIREVLAGLNAEGEFIDVEADPETDLLSTLRAHFEQHSISLPDGARFEFSPAVAKWGRGIAQSLTQGLAVVIDYGYEASRLYKGHLLDGTVRGYWQHTATDNPYLRVGEQDLTAHVDFSWLQHAAESEGMTTLGLTSQSEYLTRLGLGDWLMDLQQQPDVQYDEYYLAQNATMRLIDPAGLGRFRVMGFAKGLSSDFQSLGFTELSFAEELANL